MKALRVLLLTALVVAALYGFGRFFLSQLGAGSGRAEEPAGVLFAAPPGYRVAEAGEQSRVEAARELATLLVGSPGGRQLGLHFTSRGQELYWLVDRDGSGAATLTELAAAPSGTRIATTWRGTAEQLDRRLAWADAHGGELDSPELPPGESKNLYH